MARRDRRPKLAPPGPKHQKLLTRDWGRPGLTRGIVGARRDTMRALRTQPHLLRQIGHRIVIEAETLHDLKSVPSGGRDLLGPRRYADEYAESGTRRTA
jgi:hypothetical protein